MKLLLLMTGSLLVLWPLLQRIRRSVQRTRRARRDGVIDQLRNALPLATFEQCDEHLTIRDDDGERTILVPSERLGATDKTSALIEEVNAAWHRNALHGMTVIEAMSRVLPVPVARDRARLSGELALETRWIADDLEVAYVIDRPETGLWVTQHDVETWRLDLDQLHDAALTNLWDTTQGAIVLQEDVEGREVYQIRQGDGLDSSRLLLPGLWRQLADSCGGSLVICAPARDRIYAAPQNQPASLARLADQASGDYEALDDTVSPAFWIWENNALQRWAAHA